MPAPHEAATGRPKDGQPLTELPTALGGM